MSDESAIWGFGGVAIGALGGLMTTLLKRKPKNVQLQEAANTAVQTALNGYKDYIQTMTAAYEGRIEKMTEEHERRIAALTETYESRIADLTTEIHSLREELTALTEDRSKRDASVLQAL